MKILFLQSFVHVDKNFCVSLSEPIVNYLTEKFYLSKCKNTKKRTHSIGSKFAHNLLTNLVASTRRCALCDVSACEIVSGTTYNLNQNTTVIKKFLEVDKFMRTEMIISIFINELSF